MKITLIEPRGFCFGVCRALQMLDKAPQGAVVLHEIVHNSAVVRSYQQKGFCFVDSLNDIPDGQNVVFSAHGVSQKIEEQARDKHLKIIDTTCPFVLRVHEWVQKSEKEGRTVVLIGKANHAETKGTLGRLNAPQKAFVVSCVEDVEKLPPLTRISIATQTTLAQDETQKIIQLLQSRFKDCVLQSGICKATTERQKALKEAAKSHDCILVVGDKKSSNSLRLLELALGLGKKAYLIENATDVNGLDLGAKVAITAAASAPESIVQEIVQILKSQGDCHNK